MLSIPVTPLMNAIAEYETFFSEPVPMQAVRAMDPDELARLLQESVKQGRPDPVLLQYSEGDVQPPPENPSQLAQ